jgi:murein DD-endopeptidase MepM/ murein hydrolase activator NlpD
MNDIIASQRVLRRKRPSLLSTMTEVRTVTAGQKPAYHRSLVSAPEGESSARLFKKITSFLSGLPWSKKTAAAAGLVSAALLGAFMSAGYFIPVPDPPEGVRLQKLSAEEEAPSESDEIPLDLIETFSWQNYTVRSGDTVEGIAKRFGLSLDAVIASNNIGNVRRGLISGTKIRIPNMDGIPYTVKRGDSYRKIANSMDVPLEAVLDANDIQSESITPGALLFIPGAKMKKEELRLALGEAFIYPVRGRMTSAFGWRRDPFTKTRLFHAGMDFSSPHGAPVKAAAAGRVSATGYNAIYGNFVILTHNTYQTMYGHLSAIKAKKGGYAGQGEVIGLVGNTGRSTGAHLHFAVYKNGRAVNPLEILNK